LSYAREGDYTRAASSILPRAVSNVIVGASPNYGFSSKGDRLIDDVDAKDRLTKMIGFGNTQSQVNRLRRQRMFNNKNKASDRKQAILFQANMERTAANMISSETREAARKFNQSGLSKIKGVGAITNDSFKRSWSAWNKRRRTAEYAFERYNITYPGLTYEEVDTLARQLGLDTTMNLDIF
jgi:HD superfamily phosphohydrolase